MIKTINYAYDALGRRVTRIVQTQDYSYTRKYVYDGNKILMELNQDDEAVAVYLHGPGIDNPLAMLRDHNGNGTFEDNEVFVFTKDHLNSVRDLTDHNQKLIQRYNYSAYGKTKLERIAGGADIRFVENYFTFTSREWEQEIGIVCNRRRCHDISGRWLSEDPIGLSSGDSNFYNMVNNNPLKYTDASGENPVLIAVIIGIGILMKGDTPTYSPIEVEDPEIGDPNRIKDLTHPIKPKNKLAENSCPKGNA